MYGLRNFEGADFATLARQLPGGCGDTLRELEGHPGGLHGVIVDDPRGRVCACLVAVRHAMVTATRTIGLGIVRLAHVAQEARIGGIHSLLFELDRAFAERFEGPESPFQAVVGCFDEQDIWWLRRHCDYEPIAQSLTFEGAVAAATGQNGGQADVVIEVVTAAAIASMEFVGGPATGIRRSRELLAHGAGQPGRTAWIARRGPQVAAWAVVRDEGEAVVLEDHAIDWGDAALAAPLLAAMARGRRLRTTRWTNQESEFVALQAAGLRIRGPEHLIAARVSAFGIAPASLAEFASFGEADVGTNALPRLSHHECIATPPPPGTRSTQGDHRRSGTKGEHQSR